MNGNQQGSDNESSESRKRTFDQDGDVGQSKRLNNDNVHFKILVPSIAAGAIIGKGGEAIAQIQREAKAKVKMSKANDFYRGTTERVCLIIGSVDSIRKVHYYIMDRILEKPDPNPKATSDGRLNVERHKQVKILVPNSTAGMIIGKGGSYINEIKEQSGAYVQVSQKSKEVNLLERCVTIAGDMEQNRKASDMILIKIAEDPQSASCPNISYSDVPGPIASAYPTGSPYAIIGSTGPGPPPLQTQQSSSSAAMSALSNQAAMMNVMGAQQGVTSPSLSLIHSPGSSFNINTASALFSPTQHSHHLLAAATGPVSPPHATTALLPGPPYRYSGALPQHQAGAGTEDFSGSSPSAVTAATISLFSQSSHAAAAAAAAAAASHQSAGGAALFSPAAAVTGAPHDYSLGGPLFTSFDDQHRLTGGAAAGASPVRPDHIKRELQVSESLIGVVLGQQGRAIVELQMQTNTSIQISKKGNYAPNTRNRIISISGTPENTSRAAVLITQRVQNEELRRLQLGPSTTSAASYPSPT